MRAHRSLIFFTVAIAALVSLVSIRPGHAEPRGKKAAVAAAEAPPSLPRLKPGDRRILLVMIDGLPVQAFQEAMDAGDMPRTAELFRNRPTVRTVALSSFPSATSPALQEALSGRYADASSGEPGAVHAFDREKRRVVRYLTQPDAWDWPVADLFDAAQSAGLQVLTVFEGRWDGPQSIVTRSAIVLDAALEAVGMNKYNGDREPVEKLLRHINGAAPPEVVLLVLNAVDLAGHFHGPTSIEERRALAACDLLLGRVLDALEQRREDNGRSLLDDTTVVLFSDHGMVPSGKFIRLQPFFQRRGLITFDASTKSQIVFRERLGRMWTRWPDVILVAGGSNITQVYLREDGGGWSPDGPAPPRKAAKVQRLPDIDGMARELAEYPGIAQVIRLLDDGDIGIFASEGRSAAVMVRSGDPEPLYAYVAPATADRDPFDYLQDRRAAPWVCREDAVDDSCFHSRDAWLERTVDSSFPGAVGLLSKSLRPQRFTGDLVLTARRGYTFLKGQKGDHGNLERAAMLTPFVINGPGVVPGCAGAFVRLVDLYPTVAVLLGADPRDPAIALLDGAPLECVHGPES